MKKTLWITFGALSTLVGLYPIIYFLIDRHFGLLSQKDPAVINALLWNIGFYGHIVGGGIALFIGWIQFSSKWRAKYLNLHRNIGKLYLVCAFISSICGIYVAQFANGGVSNAIGFSLDGILWLAFTLMAYGAIRKGNVEKHAQYMIFSYALCFSAVTLRLWLPLLTGITHDFNTAYAVVGWLCWGPNLLVAYLIVKRSKVAFSETSQ